MCSASIYAILEVKDWSGVTYFAEEHCDVSVPRRVTQRTTFKRRQREEVILPVDTVFAVLLELRNELGVPVKDVESAGWKIMFSGVLDKGVPLSLTEQQLVTCLRFVQASTFWRKILLQVSSFEKNLPQIWLSSNLHEWCVKNDVSSEASPPVEKTFDGIAADKPKTMDDWSETL